MSVDRNGTRKTPPRSILPRSILPDQIPPNLTLTQTLTLTQVGTHRGNWPGGNFPDTDRNIMLEDKEKPSTQRNLQLALTFNKTLPKIKNVKNKHWHILSINENLRKGFDERPFILYIRNTNFHQLIG